MQVDYEPFIDRVIQKYEGPYGWNRKDAGGPTNYGITCFDLAEYEHLKMTSMALWAPKVQAMPLSVAETIYKTKYANGVQFDDLPAGADCCVLDYAINSGVSRALACQTAILRGTTVSAYGVQKFIDTMCAERLQFMHGIRGGRDWAEFGHGWASRVADLKSYCDHLAAGGVHATAPAPVDLSHVVTPKAIHQPKTAGTATAISVPAVAASAHAAGLNVPLIAGLAAAALAIGVGYEAWQSNKAATANATVVLPAGA